MSPIALLPDAVFAGRYRVGRCLKVGGMGAVYEVVDERTNAPRALKVMNPDLVEDPELRARFEQEARIVGGVESDHLVRTFDAGVDPSTGTPFLVMELLRGEELGAMLKRRGRIPPDEAVLLLSQAARAIDKTHAAGIVHRDLKPENLFVTFREDGTPCVKVLDFGIAKMVTHGSHSKVTRAAGTPVYMAPEQIQGRANVGPPVDVYALGQIAYTLLVGEGYWREESKALDMFPLFSTILEGIKEAPRARAARRTGAALPEAFDAWFLRAACARPDERYPNARTLVAALAELLGAGADLASRASMTNEVSSQPSAPVPPGPGKLEIQSASSRSAPVSSATAQPVTTSSRASAALRAGQLRRLVVASALTAAVILVPAAILLSTRDKDGASPGPDASVTLPPAAGVAPAATSATVAAGAVTAAAASASPAAPPSSPASSASPSPSAAPPESRPKAPSVPRGSGRRTIF